VTETTAPLAALPRRRYGRAGFEVRPLALGGILADARRVTEEEAVATIRRAIELGVELIDTSAGYGMGEGERRIGLALDSELRRRVRLQTKAGTGPPGRDFSGDGIRRSVEASLQRMRTEYLDVCLIHDPDDMTPVLAKGGGIDALVRLKEEGVIGATGLGVRSHDFHRQAIADGRFDVVLTYLDYTLLSQSAAPLIAEAAAAGLGVAIGSPLATGLLAGESPTARYGTPADPAQPEAAAALRLRAWAAEREIPLPALALQWILRNLHVSVVVAGACSVAEIEESARALLHPIPDATWAALETEKG
jgi:aryl-alcohol dehydrogenase-like predicted oxidoreductase